MACCSDENAFDFTRFAVGKVLLVDDQPELRRVFRRGLVASGFEVVEAGDGLVALELVRSGDFEVVISDVCMPRLGGLELLVRLAQEAPLLPVVLVSGLSGFADAETARQYGAFDCLEKPLALALLKVRASRAIAAYRGRLADTDQRASETRLIVAAPSATARSKRSA